LESITLEVGADASVALSGTDANGGDGADSGAIFGLSETGVFLTIIVRCASLVISFLPSLSIG
jgi:hypothetical protein